MSTGSRSGSGRPSQVLKGHGTGNDFVIVEDLDGELDLDEDLVRALCDRRTGIGGDGVLRVVRTAVLTGGPVDVAGTEFFMDYRNADGSIAEMCGNGLRVFVRYLDQAGLASAEDLLIGTRAGPRRARIGSDGRITADLGVPAPLALTTSVVAEPMSTPRPGRAVLMPNPHLVVEIDDVDGLAALDLSRPPRVDQPLPDGQNIEFVVVTGDHHLTMRVHERGVGETRSCGTGIGAVVAARSTPGDPRSWRVDVPGGTCGVRWSADGHIWLTGPAVIVARFELDPGWLASSSSSSSAASSSEAAGTPAAISN